MDGVKPRALHELAHFAFFVSEIRNQKVLTDSARIVALSSLVPCLFMRNPDLFV
jgi:hypothetical protein